MMRIKTILLTVVIGFIASCTKNDYDYLIKSYQVNGNIVYEFEYDVNGTLLSYYSNGEWHSRIELEEDQKRVDTNTIIDAKNRLIFHKEYAGSSLFENSYFYDEGDFLIKQIEKRFVGRYHENLFVVTTTTYTYEDELPTNVKRESIGDYNFGYGNDYTEEYEVIYGDNYFGNVFFIPTMFSPLPHNPLRHKSNPDNIKLVSAILRTNSDSPTILYKYDYSFDENGNVSEMKEVDSGAGNSTNTYNYTYEKFQKRNVKN